MGTFSFRLLLLISLLTMIAGCQTKTRQSAKAQVEAVSINSLAAQNEQLNGAISLLEAGDESSARQIIRQVLKVNPNHPTGKLLQAQLNQSATEIFKTQRTTKYQVKSGDTLGKIAQEWLGDSLYFVALAKLNNIKKPSNLTKGQWLVIPVTKQSRLVKKEKRRSKANVALIKQYRDEKRFYDGLDKANQLFVLKSDLPALFHEQQLTLDALAENAVSLTEKRKMLERVSSLSEKARNLEQDQLYQRFIKAQNRLLFLDEAVLLFENKSYTEAAERLIEAKKIDAKIDKATLVFRVEKDLLEKLHEQAVVLYRNQSLEQALERWSLILKLEPSNQLAQKYTERTNRLLQKLNQL